MPSDPTRQPPTDEQFAAQMRSLFAAIPIPPSLQTRSAADLRTTDEASAPAAAAGRQGRLTTRPAPARRLTSLADHAHARRWPWMVAGAVAAVVAVLFSVLFWLNRPVAPLAPGAVPPCHATVGNITLSVTSAYADATRTLVRYHTNRIDKAHPYWIALIDSEGNRYPLLSGLTYRLHAQESIVEFAPLPFDLLAVNSQRLILYVPSMEDPQSPDKGIVANGPWAACFTVAPVRGTSMELEHTPVTAQGITITPLQLDVAPPNSQPDLVNGGARVTVRLSGLDPDTLVADLREFDSITAFGPQTPPYNDYTERSEIRKGRGWVSFAVAPTVAAVLPSGAWVSTTGSTDPALAQSDDSERATHQTVGKSGAIELQIILFGPLKVSTEKPTMMTFTRLPIAILQPDGSVQEVTLNGEWQLQIPLANA